MRYISVNSHTIRKNKKQGLCEPCIAVRNSRSGKAEYANEVHILDKSGDVVATVEYSKDQPLSCGAKVYVKCFYGTR